MRIVWDEAKSRRNLAKHKVSFDRASLVFEDPLHISELDPCESEERWRTLGLVNGVVILMVAHTVKEEENAEEEIRIISARKATRGERKTYEDPR
ncbi:MAG TPA: BrnT family toxin [Candidatus Acidoferrales bacterium]|nr:BrnT family toxin [Candidatus Acidoferrales bacterium]